MSFLSLWAFWFLLLIPLAVVLYLLRLKRKRRDVSSLIFWRQVMRDEQSAKLFQKLRQVLSLLLQILFILLIILALAQPVSKKFLGKPSSRILVIDTTASMNVKEGPSSRFDLARPAARRWISQSSSRQETMILSAGHEPKVICPFSTDEKILLEALKTVCTADAAGNLLAAVEDAKKILRGKTGAREVVVLSDQAVPNSFKENFGKEILLREESFGAPKENAGILRFATRPLLTSPDTYEMLLQIKNFGTKPLETELEFYLNGSLIDVKPLKLAAGEMKTEVYPALPSRGGLLKAVLKHQDAFPVDNEAFTVLPELKRRRVLLVTTGNLFLERVLQTHPLIDLTARLPSEFNPATAGDFSAVVFDSSASEINMKLDELPNSLWIGRVPAVPALGEVDRPFFTDIDDQSPLNRLVALKNIVLAKAKKFSRAEIEAHYRGWTLDFPVCSFDDPLIVAARSDGKRWVAWTFDVLDSDLPLRVAFPLMISNTLQWLIPEMTAVGGDYAVGEVIPLCDGEQTADGKSRFFVPEKVGFYEIKSAKGSRWVAVNLFDASESEIKGAWKQGSEPPSRFFGSMVRPLWFYLVLLGALLLLGEWWLWNRRIVA